MNDPAPESGPDAFDGGPAFAGLLRVPRYLRRTFVVLLHLCLVIVANYLAFSLRFDNAIPRDSMAKFVRTMPWLVGTRGLVFLAFRLNEGMWRYAGLWDLRRIAMAIASSTALFYVVVRWGYGMVNYPRSIFLIDSALLLILMGALRISPRIYREIARKRGRKRLLIVGAGDTGERTLRLLQQDASAAYDPIGFVDDDPGKIGGRMHGVPVLGSLQDLPRIVKEHTPHEVLVAIRNPRPGLIRDVVSKLESFDVPITTVEGEAAGGFQRTRKLAVADLLARPAVGLGTGRVRQLLAGKRVLVTGAGGSIGSELSRQILALGPESLVLFERYENGLYSIAAALHDAGGGETVRPVIGDVTDEAHLNRVFRSYRPEIVFHAAAHKHVPLMEANVCEAIKNNVIGTRLTAEAAMRHGVERFILISTDKAVNPTSVMGASKRVAELTVRSLARRSSTRFVAVRFGNVLGSNGSVLLRFQDQVNAGGPVTVTDPRITRYFMLIPEAVELVLHAAAVGHSGDTLVLDLGDQMSILELARSVIRLSGRVPEKEIPIVFTGLRPGEKLYEELVGDGETIEPADVDKILRIVTERSTSPSLAEDMIRELERRAVDGQTDQVVHFLGVIVPTFRPTALPVSA